MIPCFLSLAGISQLHFFNAQLIRLAFKTIMSHAFVVCLSIFWCFFKRYSKLFIYLFIYSFYYYLFNYLWLFIFLFYFIPFYLISFYFISFYLWLFIFWGPLYPASVSGDVITCIPRPPYSPFSPVFFGDPLQDRHLSWAFCDNSLIAGAHQDVGFTLLISVPLN